ncbi:hypothetical protein CN205_13920 [Sinorhizobium meliloti]|uniref:hypothetical protein n=1 Tax=Rhizobium meliloti TaxID=382 RepID=UPI000FD8526B|nr:hypothetical protein [Sinorhizobium meliloti]RVI06480.1 hypothetical protein CN205_13920 [Sinorhizobium meliloti]
MTNAALAWAISHEPTREAYRRSTGESIGPALDRYVAWLRENIIGGVSEPLTNPPGTGPAVVRRISSPQA